MRTVNGLLLALVFASGCASTSTMGLARTLNKGALQGWVAAEGGGIVVPSASPGGTGAGTGYPMVEGGFRIGASDHVELGARLGFNGIGLEGKFALVRSPTMDSGINLSLNPGVGFFGLALGNVFAGTLSFQLPVLIGIDFAGHELVFGPRLYDQVFFGGVAGTGGGSAAINVLSAGASIGIALKAGPVRIMPEFSALVPFFATGAVSGGGGASSGVGVGGFIFQAGVGILFGSREQYERAVPLPAPVGPPPPPVPADGPPPMPPPAPPVTN